MNIEKTKIVIFRKGGKLGVNDRWFYNGSQTGVTKHFTYLEMVFSSGGSFSENQKKLARQAQKAIFSLQKFDDIKCDMYCDLFDKLITPILCHGSEVWGFNRGDTIERVHLQFLKKILRPKWNTENNLVYSELCRLNMQSKRYLKIIRYWLKIVKSNEHRLIKNVYDMLLIDSHNGRSNWVSQVKQLLEMTGFGHVWLNSGVENDFKQRLRDNFGQKVNLELQATSRGTFYVLYNDFFKNNTNYLDVVKTQQHRVALTRLRTSNHRLAVESGRWHKPHVLPLIERKCSSCEDLEEEYHFLLVCPMYTELRRKYLPEYYHQRPNMLKFVELMSSKKSNIITKLANYMYTKHLK